MNPTVGRIVNYALTEQDCEQIRRRRTTSKAILERLNYDSGDPMMKAWPAGAQAHMGNDVSAGQVVAALITAVWGPVCVNLRCILDGTDEFWATSRNLYTPCGDSPNYPPMGCWMWPIETAEESTKPKEGA